MYHIFAHMKDLDLNSTCFNCGTLGLLLRHYSFFQNKIQNCLGIFWKAKTRITLGLCHTGSHDLGVQTYYIYPLPFFERQRDSCLPLLCTSLVKSHTKQEMRQDYFIQEMRKTSRRYPGSLCGCNWASDSFMGTEIISLGFDFPT